MGIVFLGFLLGIVGAAGVMVSLRYIWKQMASRHWPTATGTVSSSVVARRRGPGLPYKVRLDYRYEVGGVAYGGKRTMYSSSSSHGHSAADAQPEGRQVVVHHHPVRPELSVIKPGWSGLHVLSLMTGLALAAVGNIINVMSATQGV